MGLTPQRLKKKKVIFYYLLPEKQFKITDFIWFFEPLMEGVTDKPIAHRSE